MMGGRHSDSKIYLLRKRNTEKCIISVHPENIPRILYEKIPLEMPSFKYYRILIRTSLALVITSDEWTVRPFMLLK